jgi:hypothetical protein
MRGVRFEPTIPVFERAKTVHALDGAATVIGSLHVRSSYVFHLILLELITQIRNWREVRIMKLLITQFVPSW